MYKWKEARVLTFDIETMANLLWAWEVYKSNNWSAIKVEAEWYPFCFAAKWLGEKTQYYSLDQYKGFKPPIKRYKDGFRWREPNIKPLLDDMWKLFNEADLVVGWNSKRFDVKKMNSKIIKAHLKPYAPFDQIDVMAEKRKLSASNSNSLAYSSIEWGTGEKLDNDGFPLWIACAEGDKTALKEMKEYCIRDTEQTERNYLFLRPWMRNHPSLAIFEGLPDACPVCASAAVVPENKYKITKTSKTQYYRCLDCGFTPRLRKAEKIERPTFV